METPEDLRARIDAMEVRLAYADQIVEELNKTVTQQWAAIDRLKRLLGEMDDRLKEAEDLIGPVAPGDKPPPHY